jgi:hypothetical protein
MSTATKVTYTYEDVLAELREIIKGREDYVYEAPENGTCVYFDFDDGEPSCLVGHWLFMHGITNSYFRKNSIALSSTVKELFRLSPHLMPMEVDERAYRLLLVAQQQQDQHRPWGYALDYAAVYALTDAEYTS